MTSKDLTDLIEGAKAAVEVIRVSAEMMTDALKEFAEAVKEADAVKVLEDDTPKDTP